MTIVYFVVFVLLVLLSSGSSRGTSGRSVGGTSTSQSSEADQHENWAAHDAGPHREMAVDVPDTFVGRTKTPPRYPPPKSTVTAAAPTAQVTAVAPVLVNNNSPGLRKKVVTAQAVAAAKPTPPSRDHLRTEEDGRLVIVNHAPTAQVPVLSNDVRRVCTMYNLNLNFVVSCTDSHSSPNGGATTAAYGQTWRSSRPTHRPADGQDTQIPGD